MYSKVDLTARHLKFEKSMPGSSQRLCNKDDYFRLKILNGFYSKKACKREYFYQKVVNICRCLMPTDFSVYRYYYIEVE